MRNSRNRSVGNRWDRMQDNNPRPDNLVLSEHSNISNRLNLQTATLKMASLNTGH